MDENEKLRAEQAKLLIGVNVVVLLAEHPAAGLRSIRVQDVIMDKVSVTPIFSTKAAFEESTKGAPIDKPLYEIDRRLLVEMAPPDQLFILNRA